MLPVEVTPRLHSHFALAGLHRNGGRNQIGMLAGFTPEQCPVSRRNGGRNDPEYALKEQIRLLANAHPLTPQTFERVPKLRFVIVTRGFPVVSFGGLPLHPDSNC